MPNIKVVSVVSCSSEDPNHPAQNLLKSATYGKWKCKSPGEDQISVVLQLEKSTLISSIDIGNEFSAFVEVLVGRSSTPNEDFKVLLVASSFMSPLESRNGTSQNRVRIFSKDQLTKPVVDERWDRIKIVCRQPFNRQVQYGLSFLTLHSPEEKLGRFVIKDEEPDTITVGSLFAKNRERKDRDKSPPATYASAIIDASQPSNLAKMHAVNIKHDSPKPKQVTPVKPLPVKKPDGSSTHKVTKTGDSSTPKVSADKKEKHNKTPVKDLGKKTDHHNGKAPSSNAKHPGQKVKQNSPAAPVQAKKPKLTRPFGKLLEGVTIVISGYQNPHRSNIRKMALQMGARYQPDWMPGCTHLICAFPNTPKFQQVKGKGYIVNKDWIEQCHSQRKKLPWRRFALDKKDRDKNESEDEICEEIETAQKAQPGFKPGDLDDIEFDDRANAADSGSDTDDEIERVRVAEVISKKDAGDPFDEDTDVDDDNENVSPLPPLPVLPNLFNSNSFAVSQKLSSETQKMLKRYIIAYNGDMSEDINSAKYFITNSVEDLQKIKNDGPIAVKPEWIWKCNDAGALLPVKEFKLS